MYRYKAWDVVVHLLFIFGPLSIAQHGFAAGLTQLEARELKIEVRDNQAQVESKTDSSVLKVEIQSEEGISIRLRFKLESSAAEQEFRFALLMPALYEVSSSDLSAISIASLEAGLAVRRMGLGGGTYTLSDGVSDQGKLVKVRVLASRLSTSVTTFEKPFDMSLYNLDIKLQAGNIHGIDPELSTTLVYSPNRNKRVTEIIEYMALEGGLDVNRDVRGFPTAYDAAHFIGHVSAESGNRGRVEVGVIFNDSYANSSTLPPLLRYQIWSRSETDWEDRKKDGQFDIGSPVRNQNQHNTTLKVQRAVDNAILATMPTRAYLVDPPNSSNSGYRYLYRTQHGDVSPWTTDLNKPPWSNKSWPPYKGIKTKMTFFPSLPPAEALLSSQESTVKIDYFLPVVLVCGLLVPFMIAVHIITGEKHLRVLGAMRLKGLTEITYWLSWLVAFLPLNVISSLLFTSVGVASQMPLFQNCNFGILFLSGTLFAVAMQSMSQVVASLTQRPRSAYMLSFFVLSISLSLQVWLVADASVLAPTTAMARAQQIARQGPSASDVRVYDNGHPVIRALLPLFAPYNMARIMDVVSYRCLDVLTEDESGIAIIAPGLKFPFRRISLRRTITVLSKKARGEVDYIYPTPSIADSLGWIVFDIMLYTVLAWYFGQVFVGENGVAKPFYFLFTREYWKPNNEPKPYVEGDTFNRLREQSAREKSIIMHNISKTFKNTTALKEVSMTMRSNEVFCLLGHNGAGKTTTFNILTGQVDATHGCAFINGYDARNDFQCIRAMTGVCPQFDTLWPDLTAREHLELYAKFVGVEEGNRKAVINALLRQVSLHDTGSRRSQHFSGGMKRRLSVAIACLGDPGILFLDEPTTGMDPLSRSRVWKLISTMKRDRIVILTTHSMEEADALGDQVGILATGRVRAVGTPLFLKNRFGSGYQANVLCSPEHIDDITALVRNGLPSAEILDTSAGAITISIPRGSTRTHIPAFLRLVDSHVGAKKIQDWGISHTTLEEVFLRLAIGAKNVNESPVNFEPGDTNDSQTCNVCLTRPTETVVLYTANGIAVEARGLVCLQCATPIVGKAPKVKGKHNMSQDTGHQMTARMGPAPCEDDGENRDGGDIAGSISVNSDDGTDLSDDDFVPSTALRGKQDVITLSSAPSRLPINSPLVIETDSERAATDVAVVDIPHDNDQGERSAPQSKAQRNSDWTGKGSGTHWNQFKAIFYKSVSVKWKQKKSNLVQVKAPLVLLLLYYILAKLLILPFYSPAVVNDDGTDECFFSRKMNADECVAVFARELSSDEPLDCLRYSTWNCAPLYEPFRVHTKPDNVTVYYTPKWDTLSYDLGRTPRDWDVNQSALWKHELAMPRIVSQGYVTGMLSRRDLSLLKEASSFSDLDQRAQAVNVSQISYRLQKQDLRKELQNPGDNLEQGIREWAGFVETEPGHDSTRDKFESYITERQLAIREGLYSYNNTYTVIDALISSSFPTFAFYWPGPESFGDESGMYITATDLERALSMPDRSISANLWMRAIEDQWDIQYTMAGWLGARSWYFRSGKSSIYPYAQVRALVDGTIISPKNPKADMNQWTLAMYAFHSSLYRRAHPLPQADLVMSVKSIPPLYRRASVFGFGSDQGKGLEMLLALITLVSLFPIMATFVHIVVVEKEARNFDLMQVMGVYMPMYWCAMYAFDAFLFFIVAIPFILLCLALGIPPVWTRNIPQIFLALLAWCHSLIGMSAFFIALFKRGRIATVVTYVIIFLSISFSTVFAIFIDPVPQVLLIYPPIAFTRSWVLLMNFDDQETGSWSATGYGWCIVAMFGMGTLLLGIGIALFHLQGLDLTALWARRRQRKNNQAKVVADDNEVEMNAISAEDNSTNLPSAEDTFVRDPDVLAERERVFNDDLSSDTVVVLKHLTKQFPGRLAVDDLAVHARRGECFGLLGPNGAGKTTTMSMLTGQLIADHGDGYILSRSITHEQTSIHQAGLVGVCLQVDALWDDLTVEEHLLFYARVRGVPGKEISAVVQSAAEQVELDGDTYQQRSSELSGGQKRLLSLGIALVGDPALVLLDEPTTGLDPERKRQAWRIISKVSTDRCILLTTHSMEEADSLCDRIGIMTAGRLQCLGSPLHLKNKFGDGYRLCIHPGDRLAFGQPASNVAKEFVASEFPEAQMIADTNGALSFNVPRSNFDVSRLFRKMSHKHNQAFIQEWSFSQASLEDVFIKVAKEHDYQGNGDIPPHM